MTSLDGYRRLAVDADSRLGWRIITLFFDFEVCDDLVRCALESGETLAPDLPKEYRDEHLAIAELVRRLLADEKLSSEDEKALSAGLKMNMAEIKARLALAADDDEPLEGEVDGDESPEDAPTILFTSLVGAKGLSASYVFVVGFNNGFFPRDPGAITDDEVCKLLAALSRTRVECHLVSCWRFGAVRLQESAFADWLRAHLEARGIDKTHFA